MQKPLSIRENSLACKYYWSVEKVLTDSQRRNMEQNESSTLNSLTTSVSSSSVANGKKFRHDHWAWDFYAYTFATLFGIFALSCFAIIVHDPAFCCSVAKSSRIALEPFIVGRSIEGSIHNSIAHRLLFLGVDSLCVQHSPSHITRNDEDFTSPSAASEHLGVSRHHSRTNVGYADI